MLGVVDMRGVVSMSSSCSCGARRGGFCSRILVSLAKANRRELAFYHSVDELRTLSEFCESILGKQMVSYPMEAR